ncbi:MAG: nucleotidyltransferase family protein [Balneolaceae bacterium]
MIESATIGVVILAAGSSSRLGRPKQLVDFKQKPLLQHVIDTVAPFNFTPAVLVLGAHADEILEAINQKDVTVSVNENWPEGIASSIRLGVLESMKLNESLESILFLLSDQPFVTPELIEKLIQKHTDGDQRITACSYRENIGVPAIFKKPFFPQLLDLKGDTGAKKIILQNIPDIDKVAFRKGYFDIDTAEDQEQLKNYIS